MGEVDVSMVWLVWRQTAEGKHANSDHGVLVHVFSTEAFAHQYVLAYRKTQPDALMQVTREWVLHHA